MKKEKNSKNNGWALKFPTHQIQIRYKKFIGIIQIIRFENNNAHIGRFIINPQKTGQGFGKAALKKFLKFLFSDKNIESVTLTVFASNKYVMNMYEKLGFKIDEVLKTPELKYIMKKSRQF